MANNHKVMTVRVDQLILSPELSVDYRHVLTSLRYRSNSFSSIPHDILLEFIMAHPPIGYMDGEYFHVISNIRTLGIKPFLPENAQIRVIVDETLCQSDIELISVQRELFNLIVFSMNGQMFASALAGLWDVSANARFKKIKPFTNGFESKQTSFIM